MSRNNFFQGLRDHSRGLVLSYAKVYFSEKTWLGLALAVVTFFDPGAGLAGVLSVLIAQLCCRLFGFSSAGWANGDYTYNSLLTGLALGSLYSWNTSFMLVLGIAALLTLFLTIWAIGRTSKRGWPYLTLPFLLTIWIILSGLHNFSGVRLSLKESFSLHAWLPDLFTSVAGFIDRLGWADGIHLYLRSLSAILFQYNDLAGILIATALLIRSRMAFALSIYGFALGYGFYWFFEGDFTPLVYSYIGFNFILTAVALGGFFLVPSWRSHLLLLFVIPLTALVLSALYSLFSRLQLPMYSLPFNVIVLLMIAALQLRFRTTKLQLVTIQQYSPEDNHYKSWCYNERFRHDLFYDLALPVMGEWNISQGYEGEITHRGDWRHAVDFVVRDEAGKTFGGAGRSVRDFYCYDLPVLAPAVGVVATIKDGIPDNAIGEANFEENWGNTIILRHGDGFYTKLSHLRAGSFKVKEGDYVQKGEFLATCGNSGYSPEPHLHFQVQVNPYIGSRTLAYPFSGYLVKHDGQHDYRAFSVPAEYEQVRNVITAPALNAAFDFVPGKQLAWVIDDNGREKLEAWTVHLDEYNRTYLYNPERKSTAYFHKDGRQLYFTDYYGPKDCFLFLFYTGFQRVMLGNYPGVQLHDLLLPHHFFPRLAMAVQDFIAPFGHFLNAHYHFRLGGDGHQSVVISTTSYGQFLNRKFRVMNGTMDIQNGTMTRLALEMDGRTLTAQCV